jgi:hypothetical protein
LRFHRRATGNLEVRRFFDSVSGFSRFSGVLPLSIVFMFLHTAIASNVTVTNYTDAGLGNGTTYYYVVTALNPGDESTNSLQASATTIGSAPP